MLTAEAVVDVADQRVMPTRVAATYVLIPKAAELTGYSVKAIERKIERGQWVEGREWIKAPDGHRMISLKGYQAWVERGRQ